METQALEIIRSLLRLTRAQKLVWKKVEYEADRYEATAKGQNFAVEFIYFARTDEVGSDRTMARLTAFLMFDFCIGTEGFDLLCEMLSIGDEDWTKLRARGKQRKEEGLRFLSELENSRPET